MGGEVNVVSPWGRVDLWRHGDRGHHGPTVTEGPGVHKVPPVQGSSSCKQVIDVRFIECWRNKDVLKLVPSATTKSNYFLIKLKLSH